MSDAELLELYALYNDGFGSLMAQLITLIFAYIVASYIAAKRLSVFQFYLASSLFAVVTISVALGARDACARAISLQEEIIRRIEVEGSQISFVARDGIPSYLDSFILVICIIGVVLAISFAISERRRHPPAS